MQDDNDRASQGFGDETASSGANEQAGSEQQKHDVMEGARSVAERGKQKLTEGAEGVTAALRHASEGLRSDEQQELARYTGVIADKLEQLTGKLKDRDLESLVSDVTRFAKQQPALFLGGAFTTGLLAARFLKSSSGRASTGASASQTAFGGSGGASGRVARRPGQGSRMGDALVPDDVRAPSGFAPTPGAPEGQKGAAE